MNDLTRRRLLATGGAGLASALLAACSSGSSNGTSATQGESLSADDLASALKEPAELTLWTWVTGIEKEVALFNQKYPDIKVNIVNAGQGLDQYTKLRTALQAGTGAPDVVQIEFSYVPTFTTTGDLLDLSGYGASAIKGDFVDWTWSQVSQGNAVYAIPQDTGPLGMLYRDDVFSRNGITPPTTWAEFAETAERLHAADPGVAMMNFANNDAGQTFGYAWQIGARPFTVDGENVTIALNSPEMKKLAEYWEPLVKSGAVSTDPDFNNDWYAALTAGTYATWVTAAWAPLFLESSAAASSGLWRAADIPQWEAGKRVSGNWGGSTSAVTTQTKAPAAAAALAMFINHDPQAALTLATEQSLFPPTTTTLADASFVGQASDFYGGQKVNELFADISSTVATDFQWSPFNDYVTSSHNDIWGTALTNKTSLSDALDQWQDEVAAYAEQQGFTVKG